MHHGSALRNESGDETLEATVVAGEFEKLPPRMRVLCDYALKLTLAPASVDEGDVEPMRSQGLDDRAIVDANQVVAYFNYVNRIADGLGVELEEGWPEERKIRKSYDLRSKFLNR